MLYSNWLTRLFVFFTLLTVGQQFTLAQPRLPIPQSRLDYFQYVFTSLSDPELPQEERQRRLRMFSERMKLDASELNTLTSVLSGFQASLLGQRQSALAALKNKKPGSALSESDNFTLSISLGTYQTRITGLGDRLLQELRPQTAERIRRVIDRKAY